MSFKSKGQKTSSLTRKEGSRKLRQTFLIVCEGEKTEPIYFSSFRVAVRVVIEGAAGNTLSLVRKAVSIAASESYDQVWCVFDRDSFPEANFDNAIHSAEANNFRVAYSNEAFELWYLLHYHYYNNSMSRHQFAGLLTSHLGKAYQKNDSDIFKILQPKTQTAIKNAKKLIEWHQSSDTPPSQQNPSTTVYLLVEELLKNSAP